jgi:hypothetical protein
MSMSGRVKTGLLGAALIAGSLMVGVPAIAADVTVGVGPGGIAFGYNDGYWDRDHKWHAWRNHEERAHWQAENREHYYEQRHDHDHDKGWRESDRYWDRH